MVRKNANSISYRRRHGLRFGACLITVLGAIGVLSTPAAAAERVATDPCNQAVVSEQEAKEFASSFIREQGWTPWTEFRSSATAHFRIGKANCVNGQWRVSVTFTRRTGSSRAREAVVLINCHSGAVESISRSA